MVHLRALRIRHRRGRVRGVLAAAVDQRGRLAGPRLEIATRTVVVAGGALHTPILLHRSGLGRGRWLGANLRIHPAVRVVALFPEALDAWNGVPQSWHLSHFEHERIFIQGQQVPPNVMASGLPFFGSRLVEVMTAYRRLASFGALVSEASAGRLVFIPGGRALPWHPLSGEDLARIGRAVALTARVFFEAGAEEVYTGSAGQPVLRTLAEAEEFGRSGVVRRDFELMGFHPMGTCRLATAPTQGVCDPGGRVFGARGLYVADGSMLPTSPRINPMLTIMAIAEHVADTVAREIT